MSVVRRVREVLGAERDGSTDVEADDQSSSPSREERSTQLFRCEPCGTTYVSTEMETCSKCQTAVESVPTEQDLGLL